MPLDKTQVAKQTAEDLFGSGLNCAESALMALAKMQSKESPIMPGIATCFGGGMAITGGPCGALTGAVMGLGLAFGRMKPNDPINTGRDATQRLVKEFEQAFGAKDCHVLLKFDPKDPSSHKVFAAEGRRERCAMITGKATEIAARIIVESNAK